MENVHRPWGILRADWSSGCLQKEVGRQGRINRKVSREVHQIGGESEITWRGTEEKIDLKDRSP